MGRGGAATRGQGIPTGVAYRVQRATTKRSYAEFSAIDIKVFYCYLVLYTVFDFDATQLTADGLTQEQQKRDV